MFGFEKLEVWKRSLDFANDLFEVADKLPARYQPSLGDQVRRASLAIPTNIAAGSGRTDGKEQAHFYDAAKGSIYEVVSLLAMTGKRGQLSREAYQTFHQEADELTAMLNTLVQSAGTRTNKT